MTGQDINININVNSGGEDNNSSIQKTKRKMYTHIVLDRSGSMNSVLEDTIGGVNAFFDELRMKIRKGDIEGGVSTIKLFDSDSIDDVCKEIDLTDTPKLTRENYVPRSMTPLYDAIGRSIREIENFAGKNPDYLINLVIVTDGLENSSREYNQQAIKNMIESCKQKDWAITYLGANQDAVVEGNKFGIAQQSAATYSQSNINDVMRSMASKSAVYASTGMSASMGFSDKDRTEYVAPKDWKVENKTTFKKDGGTGRGSTETGA